jgi:hypothetical protein
VLVRFESVCTLDFPMGQLGHKQETLIALEHPPVVTCFGRVLPSYLLARGLQLRRMQEKLHDSDPDWRRMLVVCSVLLVMSLRVMELEDPELCNNSLASVDVAVVGVVVMRAQSLSCCCSEAIW